MQQLCGTLGLCFPHAKEEDMHPLQQRSFFHHAIFDKSPTVQQLEILKPLKLVCQFLCENKKQVKQITRYDEYKLLKFAKFQAFLRAKTRALLKLKDIDSLEKLRRYKVRDNRASKRSRPVLTTLASLCKQFNLANPGTCQSTLVQV
jgi:hypothetical protein